MILSSPVTSKRCVTKTSQDPRVEFLEKIYDLCLKLGIEPTNDAKVVFDALVEKGLLTRESEATRI